jgi:hypothetical protein
VDISSECQLLFRLLMLLCFLIFVSFDFY